MKDTAVIVTLLWSLVAAGVGSYWMVHEYGLIVKDNGNGTVTFRAGSDLDTSSKGDFFVVALKNSLFVVLLFPTAPYLAVLILLGCLWLVRREAGPSHEAEG